MGGWRCWVIVTMSALGVAACTKTPTPQAQLRALFAEAQAAAEQKDIAALKRVVSEKYRDSQGQDKRAVEGVLRYYLFRQQTIHVFTRIQSIDVTGEQAQAQLFVAL